MIPYLPYQRKRFFDFCLEKFQFSHTLHEKQGSAGPGQTGVWENAHDRYGRRAVPRPAALICVDSLCSAEAARLGRTIQFSDTGLHPADARHARHLDAAALGVPVIAAGIPTLMDADEGADLVLTPRALDSVIAHGSALLAGILNRALQPRLSVAQLCWLTG